MTHSPRHNVGSVAEPHWVVDEEHYDKLQTELAAAQADAERYRRVREFLQRGDGFLDTCGAGFLDTRGWDDAGFDRMIDSLKECGK